MKKIFALVLAAVLAFSACALSEEAGGGWSGIFSFFSKIMPQKQYTVRYFVDGEEYFPMSESLIESYQLFVYLEIITEEYAAEMIEDIMKWTDEEKRLSYAVGEEIYIYNPPYREGYTGTCDRELPETMDGQDYELHAVYTIAP